MAKILVADDDPVIVQLLRVNLELEDYDVVSAGDGRDAIDKARSEKPDLIILDGMMPVMDGFAALEEMQADKELKQIPVIFLSARAQQADLRKGLSAGATEYVTKPFEPMELLELIEQILSGTFSRKGSR